MQYLLAPPSTCGSWSGRRVSYWFRTQIFIRRNRNQICISKLIKNAFRFAHHARHDLKVLIPLMSFKVSNQLFRSRAIAVQLKLWANERFSSLSCHSLWLSQALSLLKFLLLINSFVSESNKASNNFIVAAGVTTSTHNATGELTDSNGLRFSLSPLRYQTALIALEHFSFFQHKREHEKWHLTLRKFIARNSVPSFRFSSCSFASPSS